MDFFIANINDPESMPIRDRWHQVERKTFYTYYLSKFHHNFGKNVNKEMLLVLKVSQPFFRIILDNDLFLKKQNIDKLKTALKK